MTIASLRFASRLFRLSAAPLVAIASLAACTTSDDPNPDPTAVVMSDREVEVVTDGAGDATVVFEAGLGSDWTPWEAVAEEVSAHARTFAYSRPGYGQSEPSPDPRDAATIVEDLRALLVSRGYTPPYVLVGHSFGGTYMELFAKAHPEEVTGVVLVDPRHRDFTTACEQASLPGCVPPPVVLASLPQVQIDEIEGFAEASGQIAAAGGFGSYPVRVLTATSHGFAPEVETLWQAMHGSLADEAPDGEQTVFVDAGHFLQLERSHDVAEVILSLVPASEG